MGNIGNQPPQNRISPQTGLDKKILISEMSPVTVIQTTEREATEAQGELDTLRIVAVGIDILSTSEVMNMSTVTVFKELSQSQSDITNTVIDTRMGSYNNAHCGECFLTEQCPGHPGHIKFAEPIFNPIFLKDKTIINLLNTICVDCSRPYLSREKMEREGYLNHTGTRRLALISSNTTKICPGSHSTEPNIRPCGLPVFFDHAESKKSGRVAYYNDPQKKGEINFYSASKVLDVFKGVKDEDAKLMGFRDASVLGRLIMEVMLIPPLQVRPPRPIKGVAHLHELTNDLNKIVSCNNKLLTAVNNFKCRGNVETCKSEANKNLYFAVEEYQAKIIEKVQGKDALVRGLAMGKRGNYCGRAVLSPADDIELGEIMLPEVWMTKLTPIEIVTQDNLHYIIGLLDKGRITYITPGSGEFMNKRRQVKPGNVYMISVGDSVERWLQDGDWVSFGRQPTLQKQNIMAFKVTFWEHNTIGIHLSLTPGYNADFDGDEGSAYLHLTPESVSEASDRMYVCRNIITGQTNKTIIAPVYDSVTSVYLLTRLDRDGNPATMPMTTICDAHMSYTSKDQLATLSDRLAVYGVSITSGPGLFSSTLPEDFDYESYSDKGSVIIKQGILVHGTITSDHIGNSHRGIVQDIHKFYGYMRAAQFITDVTRALRIFLDRRGFTVGIDDCEYGQGTIRRPIMVNGKEKKDEQGNVITEEVSVQKLINDIFTEAEARNVALGPPREDESEEIERERAVVAIVNSARNSGIKLIKEIMDVDNAIRIMSKQGAGSKGSDFNSLQINVGLLQQYYNDQRIQRNLTEDTRSLVLFKPGDNSLESQGFIKRSFMQGLSASEMFFHMAGSREGLADTTTKVAKVGEMQRAITKGMESVTTFNDGSTRMPDGFVYQFIYGEDGLRPEDMIKVGTASQPGKASFIDVGMLARRINAKYGWISVDTKKVKVATREEYEERLRKQSQETVASGRSERLRRLYKTSRPEEESNVEGQ